MRCLLAERPGELTDCHQQVHLRIHTALVILFESSLVNIV